jgi:hypothetical protein
MRKKIQKEGGNDITVTYGYNAIGDLLTVTHSDDTLQILQKMRCLLVYYKKGWKSKDFQPFIMNYSKTIQFLKVQFQKSKVR